MTKFYLKYNPFTVVSEMSIDGREINEKQKMYAWRNDRLQVWIEKLLPELVDICNDDEIEITFHGTQLDYEDLEAHVDNYLSNNPEKRVHLDYIPAKGIDDRVEELNDLFQWMQKESPFDDLRGDDIRTTFSNVLNSEFEVSVIATMSSGKSTLINALLGRELMPSKNEACTATIVKIKDVDGMESFTAVCRDKNEKEISRFDNIDKKIIEIENANAHISYIDIEGDIPFITSKSVQLVLIDTPGPNNSRNDDHKTKTYRIIKEKAKPIVLYVLNATQLGTNDDNHLLGAVAESMKTGGKQSKDRFIFVVNKMDTYDPEKESIENALNNVRKYLNDHKIDNPNIYPVSAHNAKVIRLYQNDYASLTKKERGELETSCKNFIEEKQMHLSNYTPLSNKNKDKLNEDLKRARDNEDDYAEALIHTGIPAVEVAINEYLDKYAITIKIKTAVDTFIKRIEEKKFESSLREELEKNENMCEALQNQLLIAQNQLQDGNAALEYKNKILMLDMEKEANDNIDKVKAKSFVWLNKNVDFQKSKKLTAHEAEIFTNKLVKEFNMLQCDIQTDLENVFNDLIVEPIAKLSLKY